MATIYTAPKLTTASLVSGAAKSATKSPTFPTYHPPSIYQQAPKVTVTRSSTHSTAVKPSSTGSTGSSYRSTSSSSTRRSSSSSSYSSSAASRAAAAAAAATAKAKADYNALKNSLFGSITDSETQAANAYKGSLLDWQDTYHQKQSGINTERTNNELTKIQGTRNILDMVGNGIRSGGVTLNNNNAANSSAQQAIADAYGHIGKTQQAGVNNDYALGNNNIDQEQADLALAQAQQVRHAGESKESSINAIVQDAVQKLGSLNQSAAYANLPDRVDVESQKAAIRAQALAALSAYDNLLGAAVSSNPATDKTTNYANALKLANAGNDTAGTGYNYTSSIPQQYAGTGPFSSSLPIFTYGG